jgi:Zn-dependent protease
VAGIPVRLHYSFFLLLLLEFASSLLNYKYESNSYPMYILLIVIMYGPVLLVTILVHELGHALTTKRLGGTVDGIVVWPLGGFAICGPADDSLEGDLKVALMGPFTHIPMSILWWAIYAGVRGEDSGLWPKNTIFLDVLSTPAGFFETLSAQVLYINIILFCFNLIIPANPLDGGRVYAACLILAFKLKSLTAAKVTAITAMIISSGMILLAIISLFTTSYGNELFLGLVGVFVFYESYELWTAARRDELGDHTIFGRKCYQDRNVGNHDGGAPTAPPVLAQNDDAVLT